MKNANIGWSAMSLLVALLICSMIQESSQTGRHDSTTANRKSGLEVSSKSSLILTRLESISARPFNVQGEC